MAIRVGINGFGRIGRNIFRGAVYDKEIEFVAVNDLTDSKTLAHLLKYDSVHGNFVGTVEAGDNSIIVDGKEIKITTERNPEDLPWKDLGVDVVLECTGLFTERSKAEGHLKAGAKKVLISAPGKNEDITVCMGVNNQLYDPSKHDVISNASCTTNCLAPVAKVLQDSFGIEHGLMTTIHAFTNDQRILDHCHTDLRRARAATLSMIPTTTGAARAVALVLPELKGKLDGMAIRVPVPTVSIVDLVAELTQDASVEEINDAFRKAAATPEMKGILGYCDEPCVSVDYKGNTYSSVVDTLSTKIIKGKNGNLVKVIAWYDNEVGFSHRMKDLTKFVASKGL
jgi:glyceraldehyde 3-phosphate dehydrogenase